MWIGKAITEPNDILGSCTLMYLNVHLVAVCLLVTDQSINNITKKTCPETILLDVCLQALVTSDRVQVAGEDSNAYDDTEECASSHSHLQEDL